MITDKKIEQKRKWLYISAAILALVLAVVLFGCQPAQPYQYIQSPGGQQMVVIHDGGNDFLVDALIFSQLGYSGCVSHYHTYPNSYPRYTRSAYSNWHNYNAPSAQRTNSYQRTGNSAPVQFRNTTPVQAPAPRTNSYQRSSNYSAPSRPVFRNTSPSSSSRSSSYSRSSSGRH